MIEVRALGPEDAEALYRLRQEALEAEPLAFLATPEDDLLSSVAETRQRLARSGEAAVFGALGDELVGMVGLYRERPVKASHLTVLWGFYVRPEARGQGAGGRLITAAVDHARGLSSVTAVLLSVSESAQAAKRLYENAGFEAWGRQPDALCHEGKCADEFHMRLSLTVPGAG